MEIFGTSSIWRSQESVFYSNTSKCRNRGGKTSSWDWHESSHGEHHQHEGQSHEGFCKN